MTNSIGKQGFPSLVTKKQNVKSLTAQVSLDYLATLKLEYPKSNTFQKRTNKKLLLLIASNKVITQEIKKTKTFNGIKPASGKIHDILTLFLFTF